MLDSVFTCLLRMPRGSLKAVSGLVRTRLSRFFVKSPKPLSLAAQNRLAMRERYYDLSSSRQTGGEVGVPSAVTKSAPVADFEMEEATRIKQSQAHALQKEP